MDRFRIVRKGYDRVDVERYIDDMDRQYNSTLEEQHERIDALKMELAMKDKELARYREKEADINEALMTAVERAKELDYTAKIRFTLEGERIKIFRSKWINYCDRHRDSVEIQRAKDSLASYLDTMDREIAKVIERDIGICKDIPLTDEERDYLEETRRNDAFNLDDMASPPDLKSLYNEIEKDN